MIYIIKSTTLSIPPTILLGMFDVFNYFDDKVITTNNRTEFLAKWDQEMLINDTQ